VFRVPISWKILCGKCKNFSKCEKNNKELLKILKNKVSKKEKTIFAFQKK